MTCCPPQAEKKSGETHTYMVLYDFERPRTSTWSNGGAARVVRGGGKGDGTEAATATATATAAAFETIEGWSGPLQIG